MTTTEQEKWMREKQRKIDALREELDQLEATSKGKESPKKQVPLRLTPHLWKEIAAWAEDDFRSINGQIEFLLNEAVKNRRKKA